MKCHTIFLLLLFGMFGAVVSLQAMQPHFSTDQIQESHNTTQPLAPIQVDSQKQKQEIPTAIFPFSTVKKVFIPQGYVTSGIEEEINMADEEFDKKTWHQLMVNQCQEKNLPFIICRVATKDGQTFYYNAETYNKRLFRGSILPAVGTQKLPRDPITQCKIQNPLHYFMLQSLSDNNFTHLGTSTDLLLDLKGKKLKHHLNACYSPNPFTQGIAQLTLGPGYFRENKENTLSTAYRFLTHALSNADVVLHDVVKLNDLIRAKSALIALQHNMNIRKKQKGEEHLLDACYSDDKTTTGIAQLLLGIRYSQEETEKQSLLTYKFLLNALSNKEVVFHREIGLNELIKAQSALASLVQYMRDNNKAAYDKSVLAVQECAYTLLNVYEHMVFHILKNLKPTKEHLETLVHHKQLKPSEVDAILYEEQSTTTTFKSLIQQKIITQQSLNILATNFVLNQATIAEFSDKKILDTRYLALLSNSWAMLGDIHSYKQDPSKAKSCYDFALKFALDSIHKQTIQEKKKMLAQRM